MDMTKVVDATKRSFVTEAHSNMKGLNANVTDAIFAVANSAGGIAGSISGALHGIGKALDRIASEMELQGKRHLYEYEQKRGDKRGSG